MKYNKLPSHYENKFVFVVGTVICLLHYNKIYLFKVYLLYFFPFVTTLVTETCKGPISLYDLIVKTFVGVKIVSAVFMKICNENVLVTYAVCF